MRIHNVHERTLPMGAREAWELLDTLGGPEDRLWPSDRWPRIRIPDGLRTGAPGRHGAIRYEVCGVEPGRRVRFRFRDMPGLDGEHGFEVLPAGEGASVLRHVVDATARGPIEWCWRTFLGRLHDALLEDLLDRAEGRAPRGHGPAVRAGRALASVAATGARGRAGRAGSARPREARPGAVIPPSPTR